MFASAIQSYENDDAVITQFVREHAEHLRDNLAHLDGSFDRCGADFDWSFNLKIPKTTIVESASARFVETHSGVLVIGPPGLGKSHIATAIAIGIGAIRAGRRALVRSTFDL